MLFLFRPMYQNLRLRSRSEQRLIVNPQTSNTAAAPRRAGMQDVTLIELESRAGLPAKEWPAMIYHLKCREI